MTEVRCINCGHVLRGLAPLVTENPPVGLLRLCLECHTVAQYRPEGWKVLERSKWPPQVVKVFAKLRASKN